MSLLISVPAALLPSLLLLWYFHRNDKFPEPAGVVWKTFLLGVLSTIVIVIIALPAFFWMQSVSNPLGFGLGVGFLAAAIPEESLKYLVLVYYCTRHSHFDEPMDGLVYGVAASLGFATLENLLYVLGGGLSVAVLRSVTAVPMHAMLGAIMGYYVGEAHFTPERKRTLLFKAWAIPVLLHGLYDAPLLTLVNSPSIQSGEDMRLLLGLVVFSLSVLVISIVWALRLSRDVRALQEHSPNAST